MNAVARSEVNAVRMAIGKVLRINLLARAEVEEYGEQMYLLFNRQINSLVRFLAEY